MGFAYAGELAAAGAALCWVLCALAFTAAGKYVGSIPVNVIRLAMALVLFTVYGLVVRGLPFPTDATTKAWVWLALSGLAGFLFGDLCLFKSYLLIGPRLGLLIMASWPAMAALMAWRITGEALSLRQWQGVGITLLGVAWVVLERKSHAPMPRGHRLAGVALALLGALGQAVGYVLSDVGMGDSYDPFAASQIRAMAALLGFIVLVTVLRRWRAVVQACRHRRGMGYLLFGAFTGPFLGVGLSLAAEQRTLIGIAATIMATAPVLVLPFAVFVQKERLSLRAVLGAVLAVAGVGLLLLP